MGGKSAKSVIKWNEMILSFYITIDFYVIIYIIKRVIQYCCRLFKSKPLIIRLVELQIPSCPFRNAKKGIFCIKSAAVIIEKIKVLGYDRPRIFPRLLFFLY